MATSAIYYGDQITLMKKNYKVLICKGIVCFIGPILSKNNSEIYYGIQLTKGKKKGTTNGIINGIQYFKTENNLNTGRFLEMKDINKSKYSSINTRKKSLSITVGDNVYCKSIKTVLRKEAKGVIKIVFIPPGKDSVYFGIELYEPNGNSDGTFNDIQYFKTKPNHGYFCKINEYVKVLNYNEMSNYCQEKLNDKERYNRLIMGFIRESNDSNYTKLKHKSIIASLYLFYDESVYKPIKLLLLKDVKNRGYEMLFQSLINGFITSNKYVKNRLIVTEIMNIIYEYSRNYNDFSQIIYAKQSFINNYKEEYNIAEYTGVQDINNLQNYIPKLRKTYNYEWWNIPLFFNPISDKHKFDDSKCNHCGAQNKLVYTARYKWPMNYSDLPKPQKNVYFDLYDVSQDSQQEELYFKYFKWLDDGDVSYLDLINPYLETDIHHIIQYLKEYQCEQCLMYIGHNTCLKIEAIDNDNGQWKSVTYSPYGDIDIINKETFKYVIKSDLTKILIVLVDDDGNEIEDDELGWRDRIRKNMKEWIGMGWIHKKLLTKRCYICWKQMKNIRQIHKIGGSLSLWSTTDAFFQGDLYCPDCGIFCAIHTIPYNRSG